MNYQSHHNGHPHFAESISVAVPNVPINQGFIVSQEEIELFKDNDGKKFRRIRTIRKMARRTFLSGKLRGKYWGYPADATDQRKDTGDFYDITIYESEVFVDKYDIKTDKQTSYQELTETFSRKHACRSQSIHFEQFAENVLVVRDHESSQRYKMDLHEPALFNPRLLHGMHQSNGAEVFGTIESYICGYLVDYVLQVEETIEEVAERPVGITTNLLVGEVENNKVERTDGPDKPAENDVPPKIPLWQWIPGGKEPIFLLFLLALALTFMLLRFSLPATLVGAAILLLLLWLPSWRTRRHWWVLAVFVLLFGLLFWDSIKTYPQISAIRSTIDNWIRPTFYKNGSNIGVGSVGNTTDTSSKLDSISNATNQTTDRKTQDKGVIESGAPKSPTASMTPDDTEKAKPTLTTLPATPQETASFDMYLKRGLKAVEDEEYERANENFQQAARLSPGHPRLKALAASYKATAEQKCEQFKQANAKGLYYIPNNYYKYVASLTQTVPLKCD